MNWSARISQRDYEQLQAYLHRDDRDEHAAFLYAGCMESGPDSRLLIRQVAPIADEEFGPSDRGGYRQISARAIARAAIECHAKGLRLLWAHSHPGAIQRVGFSGPDRASHERAHPHMIDMIGGMPVGSLVFGTESVAGEVWMPDGTVSELGHLDVVGARIARVTSAPRPTSVSPERFARQVLMFGVAGQTTLRRMTVAVVGAGGGGSLLVQALAHLGVGHIVIVDFDRVELTNLSRIVGAIPDDARRRRLKVDVLRRTIDPEIEVTATAGDITYRDDAVGLLSADFIFSATDTQFARYAVNAICHQYLIPGAQIGAKVVSDRTGAVRLAYAVYRPIDLAGACLECAGAIDPDALRREQLDENERRAQDYVDAADGTEVADPSIITLNSTAAAMAMLDFQFAATGLFEPNTQLTHRVYHAPERALRTRSTVSRAGCRWCDRELAGASFGRGDDLPLPLRPGASRRRPTTLRDHAKQLLRRKRGLLVRH